MPVRRIPKNYLCVTGAFASKKNGRMVSFESLLERDHLLLLEFDPTVKSFEEQPVTVLVNKPGSSTGKYVPDVFVQYVDSEQKRPLLAEVKHSSDLERKADKYTPKFEAAQRFANAQEWDFDTVTEQQIRGQFLQNIKFLREYRNVQPQPEDISHVIITLTNLGGFAELKTLLKELSPNVMAQLHWVPTIWHLVVTSQLLVALDEPLSDTTPLALPEWDEES